MMGTDRRKGQRAYPNVCQREFTVFGVASFGKWLAQIGIQIRHHRARRTKVLEEQEDERELVKKVDAEYNAPECWMRPYERSVAELDHRE